MLTHYYNEYGISTFDLKDTNTTRNSGNWVYSTFTEDSLPNYFK